MSLVSLAEEMQAALAAELVTIKEDFTLETLLALEAINRLDPSGLFEEPNSGLFICPVTNQYNVGNSGRRERIKTVSKNPVIACILSLPFTTTTPGDAAGWDEVSEVLEFRERVEGFLVTHQWSSLIETVEAEPPLELTLGARWFMGICEFTFETMGC